MRRREIALAFLDHFCSGDIDALVPLLAPGLTFSGPLHSFNSAAAYLESLRNDPPEATDYRLLSLTEADEDVVMIYDYMKRARSIRIAQLCRIRDGQIYEITLLFDRTALAPC